MLDIKFESGTNFFDLNDFATENNIDRYALLNAAFIQDVLITEEQIMLLNFIKSIEKKGDVIKSQLFQDAFAAFIVGNVFDKTFLEFGATDGFDLSNSFMLENRLGWSGVLAEPSPQWHKQLKGNRPNTPIITDCIWKCSGEKLDFFVSDVGVLSTLSAYVMSDLSSMPGNTSERIKNGKMVEVQTISLNDVMKKNFNGNAPSYLSIDTEGSEYEILNSLDFDKYRPIVLTVEHNFSNLEIKIDKLMNSNGYGRVFKDLTSFDAWYVRSDVLATMEI
tara:strand:+ start:1917 stop:2747 length:831 start_codon:yes stop_codon:yes gene_type:complete